MSHGGGNRPDQHEATPAIYRRVPPSLRRHDTPFALRGIARQHGDMAVHRKRRRRAPRGWAEGFDLQDYASLLPERRQAARRQPDVEIRVTDDWPEQVPITDAELRVIEGHLGTELDALFGPLP